MQFLKAAYNFLTKILVEKIKPFHFFNFLT